MTNTEVSPEGAVRLYLTYLSDPASLRDENVIERLREAVESAGDPIEKLKALADLKRAEAVDGDTYKADFVANAKAWAQEAGVPVSAFEDMGVPSSVLAEAGMASARRSRSAGRRQSGSGGQRKARVSVNDVMNAVPSDEFTVTELASRADTTRATAHKAVRQLVKDGVIGEVGERPSARGKPAKLYKRA